MTLPANDEYQAIRPLSDNEMESVSGGSLTVPPIQGGPISIPSIPLLPRLPVLHGGGIVSISSIPLLPRLPVR
jgi:hypothetical protein